MLLIEIAAAVFLVLFVGPIVLACVNAVLDGDWSGMGFLIAVGCAVVVLAWLFG